MRFVCVSVCVCGKAAVGRDYASSNDILLSVFKVRWGVYTGSGNGVWVTLFVLFHLILIRCVNIYGSLRDVSVLL